MMHARLFRQGTQDWFYIHEATWQLLLRLARDAGWSAPGALMDPDHQNDWPADLQPSLKNYDVEEWPQVSFIPAGDAAAWANALDRAIPSIGQELLPLTAPSTKVISDSYGIETFAHLQYGVPAAFLSRAAAYFRRGGFSYCFDDEVDGIPPNPDSSLIQDHLTFAVSAGQSGDLRGASMAYEWMAKAVPDDPLPHLNLGLLYRQRGHFGDALAAHLRATEVAPASAEAWRMLGNSHLAAKDAFSAEKALRTAVSLAPTEPSHWSALGSALDAQGRIPEAREVLEQAVRLGGDAPEWKNNLAVHLHKHGEPEKALEMALELAARHPEVGVFQENAGRWLFREKRLREALPFLERASKENPNDPLLLQWIVGCRLYEGPPEALREAVRRHLALVPDFRIGWELLLTLNPTQEEATKAQQRLLELPE